STIAVTPQQQSIDRDSQERLTITLDADFEFIGGREGAKTAAYKILTATCENRIMSIDLHCGALEIAYSMVKELQSRPHRSSNEEGRSRDAIKIREQWKTSGTLVRRALDFAFYPRPLKDDAMLGSEDNLGEFIIGLRDLIFASTPIVPGRTTNPEWSQ